MKKVSAVIVTFNNPIMLKELIDDLLNGLGKIRAVMAGFIDGIRGKLGKNAGYLREKEILC